jgi:Ca2+-binding RTX toxin-like protein
MPYFVFTDERNTFVIQLTDPGKIAHARALIAGATEDSARVGGIVTVAPADHNIEWSFRVDPDDVMFYDVSAEVADAPILSVEEWIQSGRDLEEFLPHKAWLSWATSMVAELNEVAGTGASQKLEGAGLADIMFGKGADDLLLGRGGDDHLIGGSGNDRLRGEAGSDKLGGGEGNDDLAGGAGADVMAGGNGHDRYLVDNKSDKVIERGSGGTDSVESSVDFVLSTHVERLVLAGTFGIDGFGNSGDNRITGNAGGNTINGRGGDDVIDAGAGNDLILGSSGNDRLRGGDGDDRFLFNSAAGEANADRILDFSAADDSIWLSTSVFGAAGPEGVLSGSAFREGSAAADADDRIIYDKGTGNIFYDADGSGGGEALLFATVTAGTALTGADFAVYG